MLINDATYQRETLSERPIRQPLINDTSFFLTIQHVVLRRLLASFLMNEWYKTWGHILAFLKFFTSLKQKSVNSKVI